MSRRERRSTFYIASGDDVDRVRHTRPQMQLIRGGTSVFTRHKNYLSLDSPYFEENFASPGNVQSQLRKPRPHIKNKFSRKMNQNSSLGNIPSIISVEQENEPRPLLSPETLERLRSNSRFSNKRFKLNVTHLGNEKEEENLNWSLSINDQLDLYDDYLREKEVTKQKVDEIIRVAQALRDKLEREEAISQMSDTGLVEDDESNLDEPHSSPANHLESRPSTSSEDAFQDVSEIPRLMDLKPRIPSLMDVFVPPPIIENFVRENTMISSIRHEIGPRPWDVCWNCGEHGHAFSSCNVPRLNRFCYTCGAPGYSVHSCPYCNKY